MSAIERLREELKGPEYSEGYAESFLDSYIATQIKVLREQAGLSQKGLADLLGTRQGVISRIENVNYSKWNVSTLKKLARAFRVRLKVSFETYGSLLLDVTAFSRESLQRDPREQDPVLNGSMSIALSRPAKVVARRKHHHVRPQLIAMNCRSDEWGGGRNQLYLGAGAAQLISQPSTNAERALRQ